MRIIKSSVSSENDEYSELRADLEDILDENLCVDIVNQAFSEDSTFSEDIFIKSKDFFNSIIDEEPKTVALSFFNGTDLDTRGSANPKREYFRFDDKSNVESTDEPGEIYYDTMLDDIVDYIIDHIDDLEFPDEVQGLINEFLGIEEE